MSDELTKRCLVMLHQAHNFARHSPHDAIARVDAVLREVEAAGAEHPETYAALKPIREQANAARTRYVAELAKFRAACAEREHAYTTRIRREIGIADQD